MFPPFPAPCDFRFAEIVEVFAAQKPGCLTEALRRSQLRRVPQPDPKSPFFAAGEKSSVSTKSKLLVAMSGGVDSSVAALRLKEEGHAIVGAYMKNWINEDKI